MPKYFYLWMELTTLLICLLCYRKFSTTRHKVFLPYLLLIVFYEYGNTRHWFAINHSNLWVANIELIAEFIFYSFFILSAYRNKKERKLFTTLSLACLFFTLIDIFFIQGVFKLCSFAIVLQYGLLMVMVWRFFINKMQEFDKDTSLLAQPDFWVNTGLLFFVLSEFLFFASFNLAYIKPVPFDFLFNIISAVANIILYTCFSISFVCFLRAKKVSY